jgi:hypothetical protein
MNVTWRGKGNRSGRTRITFVQRAGPFGGLSCSEPEKVRRFSLKPGFLMKSPLGVKERERRGVTQTFDSSMHQFTDGDCTGPGAQDTILLLFVALLCLSLQSPSKLHTSPNQCPYCRKQPEGWYQPLEPPRPASLEIQSPCKLIHLDLKLCLCPRIIKNNISILELIFDVKLR